MKRCNQHVKTQKHPILSHRLLLCLGTGQNPTSSGEIQAPEKQDMTLGLKTSANNMQKRASTYGCSYAHIIYVQHKYYNECINENLSSVTWCHCQSMWSNSKAITVSQEAGVIGSILTAEVLSKQVKHSAFDTRADIWTCSSRGSRLLCACL